MNIWASESPIILQNPYETLYDILKLTLIIQVCQNLKQHQISRDFPGIWIFDLQKL